jgi:uncharacterized membrane protein YphA (DoxX/SURF4 family)
MNATGSHTTESTARTASHVALVGLLVVQLLVGYEWFVSGLTKIVRGGFPSELADELREKSQGAPGWYRSFLDGTIIPHASTCGYLIEIGELLAGVTLIGAALVWLARWDRLPDAGRVAVLTTTIGASLIAIFMAINFHLANGAPHPWLIPKDGFDEGIDLDSLLPAIQLVLLGVSVAIWRSLRIATRSSSRAHLRLPHASQSRGA